MDGLKQRIIGALVLISLAVIFVPMIFDEPHSQRKSTSITIPEEPPFPEVDMPEEPTGDSVGYEVSSDTAAPVTADSGQAQGFRIIEDESVQAQTAPESGELLQSTPVKQSETVEAQPVQEKPRLAQPEETTAKPVEEKAEFTRTLEGAWVVQLGSFGNDANARRLRDNVLEMGFGAHLQQFESGGKTLTRVFSGPFVNREDADQAKAKLDKKFGLKSLVTKGGK
ncbi:MAG: sporulation protein [Gammaproteobacteria bacterium]|uniref:Cell division protein DedD n=1 Tax=Marinobacter litoralis TaxID=187981 RepID=A0A3M2RLJ3_9GAMM|nr:SPOR domain-containing protein [Marinobacter litoralis]MBR9870972.1 sporulation protein [Gammaproteobacteria bacterium]RMJ06216.1 cell division protein DedD [Marinobacter litoralis]